MYYLLHVLWIVLLAYACVCVVYFFIQEKFIFVPLIKGEVFHSQLTTPAEELEIATPHDGLIHALLIKAPEPKGLIFYLHGNTGSLRRWQYMAEEISRLGYDVFVPDYRGYGRSRGRRSEAIMHRDQEFCYDYITAHIAYKQVVIYGRSLGTGFATRLASRRGAHKLVLETPYFNFVSLARWYLPYLPVRYLLRYHLRSDVYIQHVRCPIQIFHGKRDIIVPYSSALALYHQAKEAGKNVEMTTIVNGKHSNLNGFPLFTEKLRQFLA
ncbi:MAG: alpha/beta hydrolase [Flavobacteriales bacterium]